ncbi:uncharacterized protein P884DRAFT_114773 [Thermothelomyces heterothallicus CBS 202.75]|uniref:uncharacterized protein n=1 Tax=Thermothelomyces heterothallicus CBS 202.75 TaxID=1149848 RepID=UPI00374205ED
MLQPDEVINCPDAAWSLSTKRVVHACGDEPAERCSDYRKKNFTHGFELDNSPRAAWLSVRR